MAYDSSTFATKFGEATLKGTSALKALSRDTNLTASQKSKVTSVINKLSTGAGTATGGSGFVGAAMGAAQSGLELAGANNAIALAAFDAASGVGSLVSEMQNAKTGGDKMAVLLKNLATGMGGLIKFLKPVVNNIESYRISLVRAGARDGPKFLDSLAKQSAGMYRYGVTLKSVVQVQESFRGNLAMLTTKGYAASARQLTRLAAVNEKFGIDISESTDFINKLNIGFNATTRQTDRMSRQLLGFARRTGQPFSKVWSDFNQGIEKFMFNMDPDKALKKFTVFQRMAREMGASVGGLVDIVDRFDDLETGMQYGGELNMLLSSLGGSFDAVQATLMSQPERMQYIANQLREVGGRIEGMSELGQRAVLKQVATTTGMEIGVIKSILQKDVGADIGKYMKSSEALGAMSRRQQRDLAQQQTTRADRVQQQNDLMVNNLSIAFEGLMQKTSLAATRMMTKQIPLMRKKLEEIGMKKIIDAASAQLDKYNAGQMKAQDAFVKALKPLGTNFADLGSAINNNTAAVVNMTEASKKSPVYGKSMRQRTPIEKLYE